MLCLRAGTLSLTQAGNHEVADCDYYGPEEDAEGNGRVTVEEAVPRMGGWGGVVSL